MKGFLNGYKVQQKTTGVNLNFSITPQNSSAYKLNVQIGGDMVLKQIWYSRIGYDRTALQRLNPFNHFEDAYYFELVNNNLAVNNYTYWPFDTTGSSRYNYRNYLMGTNGIDMGYTGQTNYFLQYAFLNTYPTSDSAIFTDPAATAAHLTGIAFIS